MSYAHVECISLEGSSVCLVDVGRVESTRVCFGERSDLGALGRAVADGMRTVHVFGFCAALPLCAERNVFEGAGSLMACAHCACVRVLRRSAVVC